MKQQTEAKRKEQCLLIDLTKDQTKRTTKAIETYKGQMPVLESAIGALAIGQKFGWRVLQIVHSSATLKKYERVLDLKFKDVCPERTDLSRKSVGLAVADKIQSFWAVALGKHPVKNKDCLE